MRKKHVVLSLLFGFVILFVARGVSFAEDPTPTPTPTPGNDHQVQDLQNQVRDLESKISSLRGQEQSLSSQIAVFDSQIALTQLRMTGTKNQIAQLTQDIDTSTKKIENLEGSVATMTKVLLNRIVATYEVSGSTQPLQILLNSNSLSDAFTRVNYLKVAQSHDKILLYSTVEAKNNYEVEKKRFQEKKEEVEALKAQLEEYSSSLTTQKTAKAQLLSETQGNEANYQRLLAQAKAQLAGFQNFVTNQGGASLLSGQTVCDGNWCYYNQRDTNWGPLALNHTQYTIASDGCLVTSMAMVMTSYGHKTTPVDINSNPDNFASYYPAYLKYTISANGVTARRVGASLSDLSQGPLIVGVRAYGGTHFVVLKSGSDGRYVMNDPFLENGHDINFTDHYSVGSIFEIDRVVL